MAKITIKSGAAAPTTANVTDSELAFSRTEGKLYIGTGTTSGGASLGVVEIGPLTLVDKTEKTTVVGDDLVLIADSENSNALKKVKRSVFVSGVGTGTVTSVGVSLDTNLFTAEATKIVSTGDLSVSLSDRAANLVFAGPGTGAASKPSFRALVSADLPDIDGGTY